MTQKISNAILQSKESESGIKNLNTSNHLHPVNEIGKYKNFSSEVRSHSLNNTPVRNKY